MIYGTIQRQAAMLAFLDNFKMLGWVFFRGDSDSRADEETEKGGQASVPVH